MTRNPKPLNPRLAKYVDYINNTGLVPLPVEHFDDDWEPVGPMVRRELIEDGYAYEGGFDIFGNDTKPGLYLRPDLRRRA